MTQTLKTIGDVMQPALRSNVTFWLGVLVLLLKAIPNLIDVAHYFPEIQFSDLVQLKTEFIAWIPYVEDFIVWAGVGAIGVASRDANKSSEYVGAKNNGN